MYRKNFFMLFILTIFDVVFTAIGIEKEFIEEGNPFIADFFNKSPIITAIAIAIFVTVLLYFLYKMQNRIKWIKQAIRLLLIVKIYILILHLGWIFQVVFYMKNNIN